MTDNEPRKATEVLISLESKVDSLLGILKSQDLVIKILSNKLNDVITKLETNQLPQQKITVEAVQAPMQIPNPFQAKDPERHVVYVADKALPQEDYPKGFRRNSRPETYANESVDFPSHDEQDKPMRPPRPNADENIAKPPPGRTGSDFAGPLEALKRESKVEAKQPTKTKTAEQQPMPISAQGQVAVMQRCVDKNNKPIFLASVRITDMSNGELAFKTTTLGNGKWMASLPVGTYKVVISKLESLTKEKVEALQTLNIDGSNSKMELPILIIK